MKLKYKDKLFFGLLAIFSLLTANSKDFFAKSTSYNDVKAVINLATVGDTVFLPSGESDWGTNSLYVQGGINIIGNGANNTIIKRTKSQSRHLIVFNGSNGLPNELHNIAFEGTYNNDNIYSMGVGFLYGCINFKVSGCKFTGFANCALCIGNSNIQKGVIFKNEFINNYYPSILNFGYGVAIYGGGSWSNLELGSENSVFIEDNFFIGNRHHVTSNNNSKFVFRYNKVEHTNATKNFSMIDVHGKSGWASGSRSFEIYNNSFGTTRNLTTKARTAIGIRGGDGVIFNNLCSNTIFRTIELWNEGFICGKLSTRYQTKSLHIWNNKNHDKLGYTTNGVVNNCNLSIRENKDYFISKKPKYSSFTYPHPLRNIALKKPSVSSSIDKNHPSSFAVDGNFEKNRWWGANPYTSPQWFQVDLKRIHSVNKIIVMPYYDGKRYYHYNIETSKDGVHWRRVVQKFNNNSAIKSGDSYQLSELTQARYVKINMTYNSANTAVHLIEFQVYGIPAIESISQIVLNKKTKQQILNDLLIYPNPLRNNQAITLNFDNPHHHKVATIEILDFVGNTLKKETFDITKGINAKKVKLPSSIQSYSTVSLLIGKKTIQKKLVF